MKILIATPLYPPDDGGPATYARLLEQVLPAQGFEIVLKSFSNFRHLGKGLSHLAYMRELFSSAKDVDLIYTLDLVSAGVPACIVSFLTGKPLLLKMVGDYAWEQGTQRFGVKENLDEFVLKNNYSFQVRFFRFLQKTVARRAERVVVPSSYLKDIVASWGISAEKIVVVYNAFTAHMPTASKLELRTRYQYQGQVIVSAGRMVPWKGFKVLMDATAVLQKEIPALELHIMGSGDDAEYVEYAKAKGYDFVHLLGLKKHDELMERIVAADCFALNTGYEGLSHLLLEAMAAETPIVTTRVGGNVELIEHNVRGKLVSYNDMSAITVALREVLTQHGASERMAKSASAFVQDFTETRMIESLTTLLTALPLR